MVDYSDRLNDAMTRRGVSRSKLAAHLGVSYQAVKKVLDGKTKAFSVVQHHRAAKFLSVDAEWLACGGTAAHEDPVATQAREPEAQYAVSSLIQEATAILATLDEPQRQDAVAMLRLFAKQHTKNTNSAPVQMAA